MVLFRRATRLGRVRGLALAVGGALAGCGGDGGGEAPSTTAEDTDPSGADDPDTGDETGMDGTADETGDSGDDGPSPADIEPPPGGLRRLLGHQYRASVELLLGSAAAAAVDPPDDPEVGLFDAMATLESVPSSPDLEDYEQAAAAAADAAIADRAVLAQHVPCVAAASPDAGCYDDVAETLGRLAWRRPLTAVQHARLVSIATEGQAFGEGDFDTGLRYLLMAILQSPRFLYLVEVGLPGAEGEPRELDGYEIAARVSFFLIGRTPDAATLELAEAGELDTDEGVRALAEQMVASAAARDTVNRFFGEYLRLRELPSKGKSAELFPLFSEDLAQSMMDETNLLVQDIVFQKDESMLGLFDADYTFVDAGLAELYGVPAPEGGAYAKVTLPAVQERAGILTHASWLAMQSHTDVNSPTRRGLFVMEGLLCVDIPNPPADVDAQPLQPLPGQTLRESLQEHMTNDGCNGCHAMTDPIGFAFEHYDAIGQFRQVEAGKAIDATGDVDGIGTFDGAAELGALLRDDARVPRCLIENVYTQGMGYVPGAEVEPALDEVEAGFAAADHRMKQMLVELSASPLFRLVGEPQ